MEVHRANESNPAIGRLIDPDQRDCLAWFDLDTDRRWLGSGRCVPETMMHRAFSVLALPQLNVHGWRARQLE